MGTSTIQRAFAHGEVAPSIYGRGDAAPFLFGVKTCRNFVVMRHGGLMNRSGSQFIAEVKTSSLATYLLPFIFSDEDGILIEVGNLYFRFYQEGGQIVVSGVTAWSGATAYVVGDLASDGGVNYYCILAHTNQQPPNATYWYPLTDDIFEIPTPYATADLADLKFVQSGDVLTIFHTGYAPRELTRLGATQWTLTPVTTAPSISAPANLAATAGAGTAFTYEYVVTAVKADTYEESVPSTADDVACDAPTPELPNTLAWDAVSGAVEYNVYLDKDQGGGGPYGFIGIAKTNAFDDVGFQPDFSVAPPVARTLFATTNNYPSTGNYSQQRLLAGGSLADPERVHASRTAFFKNFTISSPIQDDDSISFKIAGKKFNGIRHIVEVKGRLMLLTTNGEWTIQGDADGVLRPTAINPKQHRHNGASTVAPIVVGGTIIYVQDRGALIRDLTADEGGGVSGRDLTRFSSHMFDDYLISRMDFSEVPFSIAYFVRNDGVLVGLTYIPDEDVWGWHRHDTGSTAAPGLYEDVCVIPEFLTEDAPYVIVKRTIDGTVKRYIERFPKRRGADQPANDPDQDGEMRINCIFMDSYLTYDGRNQSNEHLADWALITMTLTTGTVWTAGTTLTLTASASFFAAADVGNGIVLVVGGVRLHCLITAYTGVTIVSVLVKSSSTYATNMDTPVAFQGVAVTEWERAVDELAGLDHLESETVAILADGDALAQAAVTSGAVTISPPASVVHAGLPITAEVEFLDIDSQQASIRDKKKLVKSLSLVVENSRGFKAGPDDDHLYTVTEADDLTTDTVEVNMAGTWARPGRVKVVQTNPYPVTILAAIPNFELGG